MSNATYRDIPASGVDARGATPVLQCDGCGLLTFDLRRLAEIHNCQRAGTLYLRTIEGLPYGETVDAEYAILHNPVCAAVWSFARQRFAAESDALRDAAMDRLLRDTTPTAHTTLLSAVREYVEAQEATAPLPRWGNTVEEAAMFARRNTAYAALRSLAKGEAT